MNINLHIERLVLDGVDIAPGQRHLLQGVVEAELTRLLTKQGLVLPLQQGGATPRINADAIQIAAGANPTQLGRQIAASVYSGIGQPAAEPVKHSKIS